MSLTGWVAKMAWRRALQVPVVGDLRRYFGLLLIAAYVGALTTIPTLPGYSAGDLRSGDSAPAPARAVWNGAAEAPAVPRKGTGTGRFAAVFSADLPTPLPIQSGAAALPHASDPGDARRGGVRPTAGAPSLLTRPSPQAYDAQAPPAASA